MIPSHFGSDAERPSFMGGRGLKPSFPVGRFRFRCRAPVLHGRARIETGDEARSDLKLRERPSFMGGRGLKHVQACSPSVGIGERPSFMGGRGLKLAVCAI